MEGSRESLERRTISKRSGARLFHSHDNAGLFVLTDSGTQHRIPIQCAEREQMHFVEGKWWKEQHPLAVPEFRETIDELESTREQGPSSIAWVKEASL